MEAAARKFNKKHLKNLKNRILDRLMRQEDVEEDFFVPTEAETDEGTTDQIMK